MKYCDGWDFEPGNIIIALNKNCTYPDMPYDHCDPMFDGIEAERMQVLFHPHFLECEDEVGAIILLRLKCKEKQSVIDAIEKLLENPCVVYAEPDFLMNRHVIPNDPYFRYLWGMQSIKATLAWNYTTGNPRVIVGVIDSGIDYNHPDLRGNMWVNPDGYGAYGWNFFNENENSMDETGHGTHVAGTVGAVGNNFIGIAGVCWSVKLASLKIGNQTISAAAAIKAINFANEHKIPILNGSWGGRSYSSSLKLAIDNYNGLFVASAGNSGSNNDIFPVYPASYDSDNIISVAATDRSGDLAPFSNYGTASVDIAAPGADILSTSLYGAYSYMDGTSMAAPHVAGAAALLKGYIPDLTALEIKDIILSSVSRLPDLSVLTGGALNMNRILENVAPLSVATSKMY